MVDELPLIVRLLALLSDSSTKFRSRFAVVSSSIIATPNARTKLTDPLNLRTCRFPLDRSTETLPLRFGRITSPYLLTIEMLVLAGTVRSEERRVGKECSERWG